MSTTDKVVKLFSLREVPAHEGPRLHPKVSTKTGATFPPSQTEGAWFLDASVGVSGVAGGRSLCCAVCRDSLVDTRPA